jgi:hydroxymethylbilane synthase
MGKLIRVGTRESQLAGWQAEQVKQQLEAAGFAAEIIYLKTEGDTDQKTPLSEMGIQGIFTRTLDLALLNGNIDLAVHSMKDVPVQLEQGLVQSAVLKRGPANDLLVFRDNADFLQDRNSQASIGTGSIRRKAQWLNKYPRHSIHNLRGNLPTRLKKLEGGTWDGAIFAQAGLDRIRLRPPNSLVLDWMLPAPAQGAVMVVCREEDNYSFEACQPFNDEHTCICTKVERDFLKGLLGGCSTPVGALAEIENNEIYFRGNILTPDGSGKAEIEKILPLDMATNIGKSAAEELLMNGGQQIAESIGHAGK